MPKAISIAETFKIRNYNYYDASLPAQKEFLQRQNHVDIRTFTTDAREFWTSGVIGPQATINKLPGIAITIGSGYSTIVSTPSTLEGIYPSSELYPSELLFPGEETSGAIKFIKIVDLMTGFAPTDSIILALPDFPLAQVNTSESFIDFTSSNDGSFASAVSVAFDQSLIPLVEGDSEFRVPRSIIEGGGTNLERITGVRFRIKGTGSATVVMAGLRLVSSTWQYATIEYDNWNGRFRNTVPPNGNPALKPIVGSFPPIWRSDHPTSQSDPRPIDAEQGIVFYTGGNKGNNRVNIYMRETTQSSINQLTLDGKKMTELDGSDQPDVGLNKFVGRDVSNLDNIFMNELDDKDMIDLDEVADGAFDSWVVATLNWGGLNTFSVSSSLNSGYSLPVEEFAPNRFYYLTISLVDSSARARIYELNEDFSIAPTIIFDSTSIFDPGLFKRQAGRLGWQISLEDNEAFVKSIVPRHMMFAEYQSAPLHSFTPVDGAKLYVNFTPNIESFEKFEAILNGSGTALMERDASKSTTGNSYRLNVFEGTNQGIQSNEFTITDLSQAAIKFDVWYPDTIPGLKARLVSSDNTSVPLLFPDLRPGEWQHVSIALDNLLIQTGEYKLQIYQPTSAAGSWWVDGVSIFQRAVQWSARSVADDPWTKESPWTDFRDVVNSDRDGILLTSRGAETQLRGRALTQDAVITSAPKLKPRYASLGRRVWPENEYNPVGPTASFEHKSITEEVESEFIPLGSEHYRGITHDSASIYFTQGITNEIRKTTLSGSGLTTLYELKETVNPRGIVSDGVHLFWTAMKGGHGVIGKSKINGAEVNEKYIELPEGWEAEGLEVDGNYIYWASFPEEFAAGRIGRAHKLNPAEGGGPQHEFIKVEGEEEPKDVKVTGSALYFNTYSNFYSSKLDGTEVVKLFGVTRFARFFTILGGLLYWTHTKIKSGGVRTSGIGRAKLDGTEINENLLTVPKDPEGITSNAEHLYWVNRETSSISRANIGEITGAPTEFISTSTPGDNPITNYRWSFGDGAVDVGPYVTHTYVNHGKYEVTLFVVDRFGLQDQEIQEVSV